MYRIICLCAGLAASGCVSVPSIDTPASDGRACGADERGAWLGQPLGAIRATGLPQGARVIRPGDAVTEDYSDQRLNIDLDANDRVTRMWCG